jgi:hypothetical protein
MKKTNRIYWIATGLFAFGMLGSAIPDILVSPVAVEGFRKMDMPAYLIPFLGVAKLLGVITLLVPGYPRLKEWAYAGLIFDLVGAAYAVLSIGMPVVACTPMFVLLLLGALSYVYHHKRQNARTVVHMNQIKIAEKIYKNESFKITDAGVA